MFPKSSYLYVKEAVKNVNMTSDTPLALQNLFQIYEGSFLPPQILCFYSIFYALLIKLFERLFNPF